MTRKFQNIDAANRRIHILEKTLDWYGDPKNYHADDYGVQGVIDPPDYGNPGHIARLALSNSVRRMYRALRGESE